MSNPAPCSDRFDSFIERLLAHEGGYVNHPADPGGETQWGVSKRSYPAVNIKSLTRDAAKEIYRSDFWHRSHADQMEPAVAFQLLDAAVNSGISQAVRWLQRAAGVADDGNIGPVTLQALARVGQADLVLLFLAERLEFMTRLSSWDSFGKGWARRIAGNMRFAAADN